MSHYYSKNNNELVSEEKDIFFKIKEKSFHFKTDHGVFSKSGLDFGSRLLLETIIEIDKASVLDLGCGYGVIGIIYKIFNPKSFVCMTDINIRASELSKKNATINKVHVNILNGDGFENVNHQFEMILTNPPIRTGKTNIYNFFEESRKYLTDLGALYFVMHKKHGVASAITKCKTIYSDVTVINKKSGYNIVRCIK